LCMSSYTVTEKIDSPKTKVQQISVKLPKNQLFRYQYLAFFIIYNLTNDYTIISNTIITNDMLLHDSTFQMSSSGSLLCLTKITYRFHGLGKMKLLKYKMINFNKMLI
jgi:hypothetical protein